MECVQFNKCYCVERRNNPEVYKTPLHVSDLSLLARFLPAEAFLRMSFILVPPGRMNSALTHELCRNRYYEAETQLIRRFVY